VKTRLFDPRIAHLPEENQDDKVVRELWPLESDKVPKGELDPWLLSELNIEFERSQDRNVKQNDSQLSICFLINTF